MDLENISKQSLISLERCDTNLYGLRIDFQSLFLVDEELFHSVTLVALELNHVSGLFIVHDGAVASELLLNDLKDFLQIKLGRNALDGGQGLATIAFCWDYLAFASREFQH